MNTPQIIREDLLKRMSSTDVNELLEANREMFVIAMKAMDWVEGWSKEIKRLNAEIENLRNIINLNANNNAKFIHDTNIRVAALEAKT